MHRILVVDDEPSVAELVTELIDDHYRGNHDVLHAFSGQEAMEVMSRARVDILVTDVRMPAPDGIELQARVRESWPWCKVIFLSAHTDFASIQSMIRRNGIDYVLKSEEDDALIAAIDRAIAILENESSRRSLAERAERQLELSLPLRRRWLFGALIRGSLSLQDALAQFAELHVPFSPSRPVQLLVSRIDRRAPTETIRQRTVIDVQIEAIVREYMSTRAVVEVVRIDDSRAAWIAQPRTSDAGAPGVFARETVPIVQREIEAVCHTTVSFAATAGAVDWSAMRESVWDLATLLLVQGGMENGVALVLSPEGAREESSSPLSGGMTPETRVRAPAPFSRVGIALASPRIEDLSSALASVTAVLRDDTGNWIDRAHAFLGLGETITGFLLRHRLHGAVSDKVDLSPLTSADRLGDWGAAADWLEAVCRAIFDVQRSLQTQAGRDVISRVDEFIVGHLDGDVSLTRIGDEVGLNPTYLSRLYAEKTGTRLSERIAALRIETAKRLLTSTDLQIKEIASEVGLGSSSYFIKVFRAATGSTPQEYREHTQ